MKTWITVALLTLFGPAALADWSLDHSASRLHFVTTKNTHFTEVHTFKSLSGQITDQGLATLTVDLRSVETNVPDRNERLAGSFFEVARHPAATIALQVDAKRLASLAAGERLDLETVAQVQLHGVSREAKAHLVVTKLADGGLAVATLYPVIVAVEDFGLASGLEALRTAVNLPSISNKVPVTANLVFHKR